MTSNPCVQCKLIEKNLKIHGKYIVPYPEEETEEEYNFQSGWPARKTNTHTQLRLARSQERNETISRFGAHLKTHKPQTSDTHVHTYYK